MTRRAKKIIDDANKRYNNKYSSVIEKMNRVEVKINEHYDFKQEILNKLNNDFSPIIHNFEEFNIDKMTLKSTANINNELINIDNTNMKNCFSNISSNFIGTQNISSIILPISFLDYFSDATEEYLDAQSKLREAEIYKFDVELQQENLECVKSNLNDILECILDEKSMLISLKSKLENITNTLNSNMKKSSFTQEENQHLKSIYRIGKGIGKLMEVKFLNNDFSIRSEYTQLYKSISEIENVMPEQPKIDDNSWKKVLKLLEDVKVY